MFWWRHQKVENDFISQAKNLDKLEKLFKF